MSTDLPDGNYYTFDEARVPVEALASLQSKRFPKLAEDILQAALLGAWIVTKDGPADIDQIIHSAKKEIATCIGELCDRRTQEDYQPELRTVNDKVSDWGLKTTAALRDFDDLPDVEKTYLRLHFRDHLDYKEAAEKAGVPIAKAERLKKKYRLLLRSFQPST